MHWWVGKDCEQTECRNGPTIMTHQRVNKAIAILGKVIHPLISLWWLTLNLLPWRTCESYYHLSMTHLWPSTTLVGWVTQWQVQLNPSLFDCCGDISKLVGLLEEHSQQGSHDGAASGQVKIRGQSFSSQVVPTDLKLSNFSTLPKLLSSSFGKPIPSLLHKAGIQRPNV